MSYTNERMLIFAPHADDAEFGLGGWLHRVRCENVGVSKVVIAAHGGYFRSDGVVVTEKQRMEEANNAFKTIGVNEWVFDRWFEENKALSADFPTLVGSVEDHIRSYEPTEVFVCLPSFNQDHRVLYDAVIAAFRPGSLDQVKHLWAYPYPGNCWGPQMPQNGSYIELSPTDVEAKTLALNEHVSQFRGRKAGVDPEASRRQMALWGAEIGSIYAEKLFLLREIHRLPHSPFRKKG